jgi:hypothetical protein
MFEFHTFSTNIAPLTGQAKLLASALPNFYNKLLLIGNESRIIDYIP